MEATPDLSVVGLASWAAGFSFGVRQTEWGERLGREILNVFRHQFAPALERRPCVYDLERGLAFDAVRESSERVFPGRTDSGHSVLAGHPYGTKLPNKSLHGTPRSVFLEVGRFIFGVHDLGVEWTKNRPLKKYARLRK